MRIFLLSILFINLTHLAAQDLVTDRPDQTESSVVVPVKSLQIETGFVLENAENENIETTSFAYNTTLLRYGLFESTELRLGFEFLGEDINYKNNDSTINSSGLGPLYTGFKTYITEENGFLPEIAFLGALILPFTANSYFEPSEVAANMRFSFAHTLSDRFSLGYNLGAEWDGETPAPGYYYSLVLGIGLSNKLGMFVESYGLFLSDNLSEHLFDAGFTYLIIDNLQLDVSGGWGLNENAIDNFISFGFSWRIPD